MEGIIHDAQTLVWDQTGLGGMGGGRNEARKRLYVMLKFGQWTSIVLLSDAMVASLNTSVLLAQPCST